MRGLAVSLILLGSLPVAYAATVLLARSRLHRPRRAGGAVEGVVGDA